MRFYAALLMLAMAAVPFNVFAAMSSTNYYIYADSVDAGGSFSSGGAYTLQDTIGESPSDFSSSSAYEIRAGYQYMERGYLSMDISDNALNLGTLSTGAINTAITTVTVGTDSISGYSMSMSAVAGAGLAAVSDGAVSIGSEEYGFSASGSESQVVGDVAVAAGTIVSATSTAIDPSATDISFKASIDAASAVGSYSQTVTMSASANL